MAQCRYLANEYVGRLNGVKVATLLVKAEPIAYLLHYSKKRRTVVLQVRNGEVVVRAPAGTQVEYLNSLVRQKQDWLLKHLRCFQQSTKPISIDWSQPLTLPMQDTTLTVECGVAERSGIAQQHNTLFLSLSERIKPERRNVAARKLLQAWYKHQAERWFASRLGYWQPRMQLWATDMRIANWRAKWGYCNHQAEVGFNWRLLMAPEWVADYVVVHELAHIRHLNHSPLFWQLVQQYYPQAEEAKQWLRQNYHLLEW